MNPELDWTVFGIDFDTEEVVFCDGGRAAVESWRDPVGFECSAHNARVAIFRGPGGVLIAIDVGVWHTPDVLH